MFCRIPPQSPPEPSADQRRHTLWRLFWVFLPASCLGCLTETLFMLLTTGQLQNRSGVLYGPFSLVWGLGAVLFTVLLHRLDGRRGCLFCAGTLLGACFEYACSWLQEVLFGACFWDYSHLPFHINGRVNLLFSTFWGLAAVVWAEALCPRLCGWIGRIPERTGRPLTAALAALMLCNVLLSAAALVRMDRRQRDVPAVTAVERFLDRVYPDQVLQRTFSNLTYIGTDAARAAAGMRKPADIP